MDFVKEAERCLGSNDPVEVQKGLGYAILAQIAELRMSSKNTLNSRKPEQGDIKVLFCHHCQKETQCTLEVDTLFSEVGKVVLVWRCLECGKRLKNKRE